MASKQILFVCTGNSCRSVMAQHLMQHALERAGIRTMRVESAGVFAMEGMPPTRETQRVLQSANLDCATHRTRALTSEMIQRADLILVMEAFHVEEILRRLPGATGKVHLLNAFGCPPDQAPAQPNIPDPIGKPLEVYEVCFATIREAIERAAKVIRAQHV